MLPRHIFSVLSRRDGDSSEIDDETFRSSEVYTDSLESYKKETPILFDRNYNVKGEIGSVIGQDLGDRNDIRTVFASFGKIYLCLQILF